MLWTRLQGNIRTITGNNKFGSKSNIPLFRHELENLIKELYSIEDDKTVKLTASNHVDEELEPSFRETVKILKLSGSAR